MDAQHSNRPTCKDFLESALGKKIDSLGPAPYLNPYWFSQEKRKAVIQNTGAIFWDKKKLYIVFTDAAGEPKTAQVFDGLTKKVFYLPGFEKKQNAARFYNPQSKLTALVEDLQSSLLLHAIFKINIIYAGDCHNLMAITDHADFIVSNSSFASIRCGHLALKKKQSSILYVMHEHTFFEQYLQTKGAFICANETMYVGSSPITSKAKMSILKR